MQYSIIKQICLNTIKILTVSEQTYKPFTVEMPQNHNTDLSVISCHVSCCIYSFNRTGYGVTFYL